MAEDNSAVGAEDDEATPLNSKIEALRDAASEIASETTEQKKHLAELARRIDELHEGVTQTLAASASQASSLEKIRSRAKAALAAIEEDTRKANSESAFAFNAKGNAEEHAKAIAQIRGTVEATFSGLAETKRNIEEVAQMAAALRVAAESDVKAIADAKMTVIRDEAAVTAASERVAAVMPTIDKGSKDANAISAALSLAETNAESLEALHTQMTEATVSAAANVASIKKADAEGAVLVAAMADTSAMAQVATQRVLDYETELTSLRAAFDAMNAKLEGLLPHATSAGLASAFHSQKARFSKPQPYWLGLFVFAIICLLGAACYGLPGMNETWDSLLRHFVNRLPIVAPLVWLAIYAGHHYNMALRMEEDYAFKEAVSTAFEGYKREMQGIPARDGNADNPLVILCENVLRALAERPGRIYEGPNRRSYSFDSNRNDG